MILPIMLLLISLGSGIQTFKILVLFPTPSFSHQRPIMVLTERLVQKGHQLYVVSPNIVPGLKSDNYTYVDTSFSYESFTNGTGPDKINSQQQQSKWSIMSQAPSLASMIEKQFRSEPFLRFQKRIDDEKIKFDVVIIESIFTTHTCAMARVLTGNAPIITMSTVAVDPYGEIGLGSIDHASFVPFAFDAYTDKMSLWQKMDNWFSNNYIMYRFKTEIEEAARVFYRETYGNENLVDGCSNNMSLSLITSNYLYFYPRLLGPNVIELGPLHIKAPEKLPKNLQDWMDGADKGVIYFSLGSNMKSISLPEDVRTNFLKFFRELPSGYRVVWKWEREGNIPGQSDNILAQKWMPQQSVLAHPKVRVFIMQGGLQSFQETVHYGVPTVGIPWFGDQECNVAKMVDAEIGVRLRPQELSSFEKIKAALEAVLYDERYSKNMKRLSAISRDFTSQALDRAVFWVEHVARHGGASHLRPSTADTTYFQFFCLDIIAVILASVFVVLYVAVILVKFLIFSIFSSSNLKIKES